MTLLTVQSCKLLYFEEIIQSPCFYISDYYCQSIALRSLFCYKEKKSETNKGIKVFKNYPSKIGMFPQLPVQLQGRGALGKFLPNLDCNCW